MSDRIEKSIHLDAPVARVWSALVDHEAFGSWFRVKIDAPFVVGETSRGRVTYPGYEHLKWEATITAIEPQRRFAFSWHPAAVDPQRDYASETPTQVEFHLVPEGTGSRLTVIERGFDALPPQRRDEAWRMNDAGWSMQMENIRAHVGA